MFLATETITGNRLKAKTANINNEASDWVLHSKQKSCFTFVGMFSNTEESDAFGWKGNAIFFYSIYIPYIDVLVCKIVKKYNKHANSRS